MSRIYEKDGGPRVSRPLPARPGYDQHSWWVTQAEGLPDKPCGKSPVHGLANRYIQLVSSGKVLGYSCRCGWDLPVLVQEHALPPRTPTTVLDPPTLHSVAAHNRRPVLKSGLTAKRRERRRVHRPWWTRVPDDL